MTQSIHEIRTVRVNTELNRVAEWVQTLPHYNAETHVLLKVPTVCVREDILERFDLGSPLQNEYLFVGMTRRDSEITIPMAYYGDEGEVLSQSGVFEYQFSQGQNSFSIWVISSFYGDSYDPYYPALICLSAVPKDLVALWAAFTEECYRLRTAFDPSDEVEVIGGRRLTSFAPNVDWDDIVLPEELKEELLNDVKRFFSKGVDIYNRLRLKPFRKLLLAGIPGTGKTMLCSALAKWAISQGHLVIYISSADPAGASFDKIERALEIAADSRRPTVILLEELDAYLNADQKALVLNVLDGSESIVNTEGTLLIATTNYPEAIDERVLKRPGRLDRIFIIPEVKRYEDAEKMLHQYLGDMWNDDHKQLAAELVGYPGAFIREVAIYALTQVAYEDLPHLSLDLLDHSYRRLREQIEARDDFLHNRGQLGLVPPPNPAGLIKNQAPEE